MNPRSNPMTRTAWDVTVTLDVALPAENVLAEILGALPAGAGTGRSAWSDRLTVSLELYATSPARAGELGVELAEHAIHAAALERADGDPTRVVGIEVLTPEEVERRRARAEEPLELVSVTEAADLLGVTPGRIRQRAAAGDLGAIKVGDAGWAFPRALVEREAATH
jgi:excisionase family DNA binding protein